MHIQNSGPRYRVGVLGGSGYTGRELLRILHAHGGAEVIFATSRSEAGAPTSIPDLRYTDPEEAQARAIDLLFLCLPHGEAAPRTPEWLERGVRVVDLTADHRPGSGREEGAVYGLPERAGPDLAEANLVANPGCYPTGALLALAPLLERGAIDAKRPVVIDAASGVSGAGRAPRRELLFAEVAGDYRAYAVGNRHRHLAEMRAGLPGLQILFTPHLLPVSRGILETIHMPVERETGAEAIREAWTEAYRSSPGVRVVDPSRVRLSEVTETDRVLLSAEAAHGVHPPVITLSVALDNLGKGAAGQAVQCMNRMLGFPEARGLRC